jgi:hypothetical protein
VSADPPIERVEVWHVCVPSVVDEGLGPAECFRFQR